jgi:acyl-CoA thioesterase
MVPFPEITTVTAVSDGVWSARISADWAQGRASFGGVLSGVALRALRALVADDRRLRSVLVDFIAPAAPGDLEIEARILRAGRALTQAEARVHQDGVLVALVVAAYGADRATAISWPAPDRTDLPDPTTLMAFPYLEGITPAFTRHFDYRWATHRLPFTGSEKPEVRGFVRPGAGEGGVDEAMVLALIDSWPAPVLAMAPGPAPASTVTWMVDLVGPVPGAEAEAPGGYWWFEGDATAASDGYADIHGRLYDPDGRLVATSRQLVVEFSRPA